MTSKLPQINFNFYEAQGVVQNKMFEQFEDNEFKKIYKETEQHVNGLHDFDFEQSDPEIYNLMSQQNQITNMGTQIKDDL